MGIQFCFSSKHITTMKVLFVVALALAAVVAEPEADAAADAYYGYYGRPAYYGQRWGGYNGYYGNYYGYGGYPRTYGYGYNRFWKREAEAEPEAKPEAAADAYYGYYGYPRSYGYGNYYGYGNRYYGNFYGYGNYHNRGYYGGYGRWGEMILFLPPRTCCQPFSKKFSSTKIFLNWK